MIYTTENVYVDGSICGPIWWPVGALCGKPLRADLLDYPVWNKGDTFRDWLLALLMREGGDFQSAKFTEDTVIRVVRRSLNGVRNHRTHTREILVSNIAADLVNADAYLGDFMGDYE